MKKYFILLVGMVISVNLIAQTRSPYPTRDQIEAFKKSKTLVVIDFPNTPYNVMIKKSFEESWKLTPFEFISSAEFEEKRVDPSYSFVILAQVSFDRDKEEVYYNFINLLLGDTAQDITLMPEFLSFPLSYLHADPLSSMHVIPLIVRFMENHLRLMDLTPQHNVLRNLNYYNRNARQIKSKQLLINKEHLAQGIDPDSDLSQAYPHSMRIVEGEEIDKVILEKTPGTVVLHQVGPGEEDNKGRSYKVIFGVDDAKVYFFDFHTIGPKTPDGFLLNDFRRIK